MTTTEILERAECARDTKARRISNVAPNTLANITAETLETGVELEALESLNVPVFRYGTQITIHGKLPDFDEAARPGGYRAVFRNANGTVGVRYAAIDGKKKAQLQAVSRVVKSAWGVHANSSTFEIVAMVSPTLERDAAIAEAKRLFAMIPTERFFGSAHYARGMFGEIFVVASIGALYAENLWPLCSAFFGIGSPEQFEAAKTAQHAERAAQHAQYEIEREQRNAESAAVKAKLRAEMLTSKTPLASVPDNCTLLVDGAYNILTVKWEKDRGRFYYTITHRDGEEQYGKARKLAKDGLPWPKAMAAGKVFLA